MAKLIIGLFIDCTLLGGITLRTPTSLSISQQYRLSQVLYFRALRAIVSARREGRASNRLTILRYWWLTNRFSSRYAQDRIERCVSMIEACGEDSPHQELIKQWTEAKLVKCLS